MYAPVLGAFHAQAWAQNWAGRGGEKAAQRRGEQGFAVVFFSLLASTSTAAL